MFHTASDFHDANLEQSLFGGGESPPPLMLQISSTLMAPLKVKIIHLILGFTVLTSSNQYEKKMLEEKP